jgi:hypothetical protein
LPLGGKEGERESGCSRLKAREKERERSEREKERERGERERERERESKHKSSRAANQHFTMSGFTLGKQIRRGEIGGRGKWKPGLAECCVRNIT